MSKSMEKSERKRISRRLYTYVFRYKSTLIAGLVCLLIAHFLNQSFPIVIKFIIKAIDTRKFSLLLELAIFSVALFLVKGVFLYFSSILISMVGQKVITDLRDHVYERLLNLSLSFYDRRRTGELMSRVTNDVSVIQGFISAGVVNLVTIPITILTGFGVIIYLSAKLTVIAIVALPLIALLISTAGRRIRKVSTAMQVKLADLSTILQETLSSIRIVKSFSMEKYEAKRFSLENRKSFNITMRSLRIRAVLSPFIEVIAAFCIASVFLVGGHDIIFKTRDFITGRVLEKGDLLAFLVSLQLIYTEFSRVNDTYLTLQQCYAAAERLFQMMDVRSEVLEKPDAAAMEFIQGAVAFDRVSFAYDGGEPVLNDICHEVRPGLVTALVGTSGAGKSTFVNMIPRFYDVTEGAVRIDGVDVRDVTLASLREQMGIVPQETVLFSTTIAENITYGRQGASMEEIVEAAKAANAHGFVSELPDGYTTMVGERGVTLSGGQRQRISIARAILKDPRILILDEATSSVDSVSEAAIQEALETLMRNRTTFIVAHRLSTIQNADIILVIEKGRIVERGRHQELYDSGGVYRNLYDMTLQKENGAFAETIDTARNTDTEV